MSTTPLKPATLASYGLGSVAPTVVDDFCGAFLLKFYTDLVGLDPASVGYVLLACMVLDVLAEPAIGYLSDRTRFSSGRRRPYFLIGSLPGILLFFLVFNPPQGSSLSQFAFLTVVATLMLILMSLSAVPHMAMSFEMTDDYDQRVRVVGYRSLAEDAASILALFSVPIALGFAGTTLVDHVLTRADCYLLAAGSIGAICMVTSLIAYFGTTEHPSLAHQCRYRFRDGIVAAIRNKAFLILLTVLTLVVIAHRVTLAQLFILLEHFHGKPEEKTTPLLVSYYVGSLGSVAVWIYLGTRFGKNRILRLALIGWPMAFLALVVHQWSTGLLCAVAFFMGALFCGIHAMLGAIAPEILDLDRSESGQRREGVFASVTDLVWPAGLGIGFLLAGLVLQGIGYRGSVLPTEDVVTGLRISVASFPLALGWGSLIAFSFFPLTKKSHDQLLRDLSSAKPFE